MSISRGQFQNDINILPNLPRTRFENIFRLYQDSQYYFFNILKTIHLPNDIDPSIINFQTISGTWALPVMSYRIYGTMDLWWLIAIANGIDDPTQLIKAGTKLKIIKKQYVSAVLESIENQLQ